jgi:hypothetical protein
MTHEHIVAASMAKPFQPFVIHLAGGAQFRVISPEFLVFLKQSRIFVVHQPNGSINLLDPFMVTHLEFRPNSSI